MTFRDLGLNAPILRALEEQGYAKPSPIQEKAIPPALKARDVLGCAQTGTGKTCAFAAPILQRLAASPAAGRPIRALILTPTRELAIQIADELRGLLTFYKDIRVTVVYGGQRLEPQIRSLQQHPQIVVATPGRLMDHYNRKNLRLDRIKTVILDEADRMLDMGFFDDVTKILDRIKNRTNLGLFSATISQEVMTVSWMYQRDEVEITVAPTEESKPDIDQYSITVPRLEKEEAMLRILRSGALERVIVFCNTKVMCQRLSDDLRRAGIRADCLHGDIKQATREKTMADFRHGKLPVLIATDVASRGIDVDDVDGVINYDVPEENEYYIHRIGRTGRAKRHGVAFSLVSTITEGLRLDDIQKVTGSDIRKVYFNERGDLVAAVERP